MVQRLTVRATTAAGSEVAGFVQALSEQGGLTERQSYRLRLAVDEIVTNIVLHGYRGQPGPVQLEGGTDGDQVWLRIVDEAPAFDPTTHDPRPRLAAQADGREGGFGLFLAMSGVDDFSYDRTDGHNRNTLVMRRS
ncbi:MAG TPA: ATP-binding protein [Mycobacteriales bacterium]|jgi:anti-sigma regulatory factor (Ser/Thr protein kinase)|nr:ATP-binding protein [Mycobacteriales bacterium]